MSKTCGKIWPVPCLCRVVEYDEVENEAACEVHTGEAILPRVGFKANHLKTQGLSVGDEFVWFMPEPPPEPPPHIGRSARDLAHAKARIKLIEDGANPDTVVVPIEMYGGLYTRDELWAMDTGINTKNPVVAASVIRLNPEGDRESYIEKLPDGFRQQVRALLARNGAAVDKQPEPTPDEIRARNAKFLELIRSVPPINKGMVDAVCQFTRNKMWRMDYVPSEYFLPGRPPGELAKLYRELALFGYIALDADGKPCCLTGKEPKIPREPMTELQADVAHLLKTLDDDGYVMGEEVNKVVAHLVRLVPLERRVNWMLDQKFDDLCWLDLYRDLGKILGREFRPEQMPREQFLANCAAYHDSLARDTEYRPPYADPTEGEGCRGCC